MPDLLFGPVPADDAVDFIKSKPVVSREVFNGLLPELKARAFCVTGIENVNVLQRVRDKIGTLPAGADWDDVKKDVYGEISPYLVDDSAEPEERDRQIVAANRRAELLLRVHGFQAYQSAAFDVADRNRATHPYWQYMTMEDDKVRPSHAALDGLILPADSPFWHDHYPPWDWGCRCQCVPISQDDFDDAQKADKKLPADDRMVLDGARQVELETSGRLVRGPNKIVNCASPVAMGKPGAFSWDPGSLRIPLDQLQARYAAAPDIWRTFETWAKKTELRGDDQRTVWGWLNGEPTAPKPPLPPPWAPLAFANDTEAADWADANMHPRAGLFTPGQLQALTDYQGNGYSTINQELRNWRGAVPPAIAKDVSALDAALAVSQTPENLTVFRGLDQGIVAQLQPGDGFVDHGFASTSLSEHEAETGFSGGAMLEIQLPAGSSAVYLDGLDSAMASEIELLLARGTPMRCLKREMRGGVLWITLEVV